METLSLTEAKGVVLNHPLRYWQSQGLNPGQLDLKILALNHDTTSKCETQTTTLVIILALTDD